MYVLEFAGQDDAFAAREAASATTGVTRLLGAASVDRSGSVAVRAVDVRATAGVDTQRAERVLGGELVDRGFTVDLDDPDHELRALFAGPVGDSKREGGDGPDAGGVCALGWLAVESRRDFGDREPADRPFFQPGSMDPLLARALVNIAGARPGHRVLDPMCGTGGTLVEAGLVGARVVGADAQAKMVDGARENLADALGEAAFDLCRDRPWADAARAAGWTVDGQFRRRVHRSLDRHVLVLE
ncbi:TIGR01177 family methyltransferase [Halobacteriales archaeon QH_10_67_22]|nr:MAG: TIGR01177 family methyltransferase [Halobacteriales archaeon QH_10_67_22]